MHHSQKETKWTSALVEPLFLALETSVEWKIESFNYNYFLKGPYRQDSGSVSDFAE